MQHHPSHRQLSRVFPAVVVSALLVGALGGCASAAGTEVQTSATTAGQPDPVALCTSRVMAGLRLSAVEGPEFGQSLVIQQAGTESVEYEAYLRAMNEDGFFVAAMTGGVDRAATAAEPQVRGYCVSATSSISPALPTPSDPCTAAVMAGFREIVDSGDDMAGSDDLLIEYGYESREFATFVNLQGAFVMARLNSGSDAALREITPQVEDSCAGRQPRRATSSRPTTAPHPTTSSRPALAPRPTTAPSTSPISPTDADCYERSGEVVRAVADGRLTLVDPGTGRRVDLESFGPTNSAVFAQLLPTPTGAQHVAQR